MKQIKYFTKKRTPEETSIDINRAINFYLKSLDKSQVLLIGYSFGADILPFIINRLPNETREHIKGVVLLGIGTYAQFEILLASFIGVKINVKIYKTLPEINKITDIPIFAICGMTDKNILCPYLKQDNIRSQLVPGNHHFNQEYKKITEMIIDWSKSKIDF